MKALYKLILKAFIGPFFVTFSVVTFILLTQYMMKYVDDFAGKGIGMDVFAELFFYFGFNMVPRALPLAVLLSCLMTFGNLGQHNELTAIKSAGIPLPKVLFPVFVFVMVISVGSFFFANRVLPKTNLKAYSLLYDIRKKKPALDFKEGVFYNGIPGYSIRIGKKFEDGKTLKDLMIYEHGDHRGNTMQIVADSGQMYPIMEGRYLVFELFDGKRNADYFRSKKSYETVEFSRMDFSRTKMVFDVSSFQLGETPEQLFKRNRFMLNIDQVQEVVDSLGLVVDRYGEEAVRRVQAKYKYPYVYDDSLRHIRIHSDTLLALDTLGQQRAARKAADQARAIIRGLDLKLQQMSKQRGEMATYTVEKLHKYTEAFECIVMFLIGASIGIVIKKGGLGLPALITIAFFIIYYVISIYFEKIARADKMDVYLATWLANLILLPVGLFFLYQAHNDAQLFEWDAYRMFFKKLGKRVGLRKKKLVV